MSIREILARTGTGTGAGPGTGAGGGLASRLLAPVDVASLAVFRVLFGVVMGAGMVRFVLSGWVEILHARPKVFFRYHGLEWLPVPGPETVALLYWVLAGCCLLIALGLLYRLAAAGFFLGFTFIQAIDVTNYLNHYYLVCLLALLLNVLPLHRAWSVDAWLRPRLAVDAFPAWMVYLVRFQYGAVYFHAGLAKLGSDWLLHAQPLGIWLGSRGDFPVLGPLFAAPYAPYVFSWAGFLFDSTIWIWLLGRRTRLPAFLVLLVFHALTRVLFDIGMFPFIMSIGATVFFSPGWPRRLAGSVLPAPAALAPPFPPAPWRLRAGAALLVAYSLFQALFPLRHFLYPGNVLWHEQGMRFAWKVMVREKNGSITYRVRKRGEAKEWYVSPRKYLEPRQLKEMWGQPDLILQLAHHIADEYRRSGVGEVEVRVDALVSLNGRPARRMIDPTVDLARIEDGVARAGWILPEPEEPPLAAHRPGRP